MGVSSIRDEQDKYHDKGRQGCIDASCEGLGDTCIYNINSGCLRSHEIDVLTDTVEDNDRRVDRVSDDSKQAGDRCGTNGPLCEGIACNYNQYVMDKG